MTKTVEYDKNRTFIVYQGTLDEVVVYIGMGSEDRHLHLNSGVSHLYEANKAHFQGKIILTEVIQDGLSKEEALQLERVLIEEKQPPWNSTFTEAIRLKRVMGKVLSKYNHIENKSTYLQILLMSLGKVQADYSFILESRRFISTTGLSLAGWVANYKNAKGPHKFIDKVEKVKSGAYRLTLNKDFVENMLVQIETVRLTNGGC